jgi:toxin-antitoxin system PIN domain toxin
VILPDVNLLVYGHRTDPPMHAAARTWLDAALVGSEPLGLSDEVLASFLRIVTNRRIYRIDPTPIDIALAAAAAWRAAPSTVNVRAGARHWDIFTRLCQDTGAAGNDVPDAYLAALAIELDAELQTADTGFARFTGLRWRNPLVP